MAVGVFCMKGKPDEQGKVEMGYSIVSRFRNNGLTTEALHAILDWVDNYPGVTRVKAETLARNYPSIRGAGENWFSFLAT